MCHQNQLCRSGQGGAAAGSARHRCEGPPVLSVNEAKRVQAIMMTCGTIWTGYNTTDMLIAARRAAGQEESTTAVMSERHIDY
jgi:hypothetical protein